MKYSIYQMQIKSAFDYNGKLIPHESNYYKKAEKLRFHGLNEFDTIDAKEYRYEEVYSDEIEPSSIYIQEETEEKYPNSSISRRCIYNLLEYLFDRYNLWEMKYEMKPSELEAHRYVMHSLSSGNVIVLEGEELNGQRVAYFVNPIGWKEIKFII